MPYRKDRTRKKQLTPCMRHILLGTPAEFPLKPGQKVEEFMFRTCREPERSQKLRALWIEHRSELLAEWKAQGRKGKPWGSKRFDKKEKI